MNLFEREPMTVAPGAFFVPSWLSIDEQILLLELCRQWGKPPAGFVVPRMADGTPLSIKSLYLGWNWRPGQHYTKFYDEREQLSVKEFPPELAQLAQRAYRQTFGASGSFAPDAAIINWYDEDATLGLHQDKGETDGAIARGSPVITVSLGDSALFRFGNTVTRGKPYRDVTLESGDLFVFGGPSRMAYHGIMKLHARTAPPELGPVRGRLSITIRETGLAAPKSS